MASMTLAASIVSAWSRSNNEDSVLQCDLARGQTIARRLGACQRVGELIFVPNAPQAPEDDGVLMGFVYEASIETIAAIHLPDRVASGFHGNWAPTAP
jgi:carotenoid cleavage dioxygenase